MLNKMNEIQDQLTDSGRTLARQFMHSGLDALHQANPLIFNPALLNSWKSTLEKTAEYVNQHADLANDLFRLSGYSAFRGLGLDVEPVATPEKSDHRFRHESWNEYVAFDHIKQFYLLVSRFIQGAGIAHRQPDEKTMKQMDFYTRQWLDALSPSNFVATNPVVLKETLDRKGENLVQGARALLEDFSRGKGRALMMRMTDSKSFEVGENIATTEGKVIYQNELMQLIQYSPTTKTVYETPLLIVPPWINKFYILDLRRENSFIRWAVDQAYTVFIISWVNPDRSFKDTRFDDYMLKGVLAAADQVRKETGINQVNTIGYCIGGTLLAATNAYLAKKRRRPIKTATYFTTMVDFEEPGDLGVFIDDNQLDALDANMEKDGYLEGTTMATIFNMLRSNDLIWPFFINNYLLGRDPAAFDLLYWNSDSTRLPQKTHSFYLRNCYLKNLLREPDAVELDNTPLDLGGIRIPTCFISTHDDHITPWKSTYAGAKLLSGPVRFVLSGSGHIAGIINPPTKNKYGFWSNDKLEDNPDTWLENANYTEGSWWPDWHNWLKKHAGKKIAARGPGKKLTPLEDAPGSYVRQRGVPD